MIAALSLIALFTTIVIGIIKPKVNIGLVALAFAVPIGMILAKLTEKQIVTLFPSGLFLTLLGVTAFFGVFEQNGLLSYLADKTRGVAKTRPFMLPILFFIFTAILSASGPGNIASTAMIAPIGMSMAYAYGISPLLMAIMICTGANAGAFSPIAPTGVILSELGKNIKVIDPNIYLQIFLSAFVIQSISAVLAFFIFFRKRYKDEKIMRESKLEEKVWTFKYTVSVLALIVLLVAITLFKLPLGFTSILLAVILMLFEVSDTEKVFSNIPWEALILVCGVSVLIGVLEKAGGLELATSLLANVGGKGNINGLLAFTTGVVSAYSSSSGVVMPAFIPLVPGLISKIGGGDTVKMLTSIAVGSHMVDVSPLSTLGALCIAQAKGDKQKLFRSLMIWGLSMAVFGTIISYVILDLL
ncbi:MAG: SLC13 family permease [Patescibacteria group bacterium]